jgi:hypothetical protein
MRQKIWGRWISDGDFLRFQPDSTEPDPEYDVRLGSLQRDSDLIEIVSIVSEKRWATKEDISDLTRAGREILAELQERRSRDLCPETDINAPRRMSWEEYGLLVQTEWTSLLDSADPLDESLFQRFLETHPCLLPDSYATFGGGHNGTVHNGFISQPELPGFQRKQPDFMIVTHDSAAVMPILIEIEAPGKPWATANGVQSAKLTQAIDQLRQWKSWFSEPENVLQFRRAYAIDDSLMRFRQLEPKYVLIYGRRAEASAIEAFAKKRALLEGDDEVFMTYDRLAPGERNRGTLMLRVDRTGPDPRLRVVTVPPTFTIDRWDAEEYSRLTGREEAIRRAPLIADERKAFLLRRTAYSDEYVERKRSKDPTLPRWE